MRPLPDDRRGLTFGGAVIGLAVVGLIASVFLWRHGIAARAERDAVAARRWAAITVVPVLPAARLRATLRVAIVRDTSSDRWYGGPATLDSITRRWQAAIRALGADARIVAAADLPTAGDDDVLVVPATPCLGGAARAAVERTLARGHGVITTWLSGTRDGACADAGYQFITTLTQASRVDTLDARPLTYVTFPDGGVLAADLPPGATLQVRSAHDGALRRPGRDAYYSDGVLNPAGASRQPLLDAAVTHLELPRGRVVYWGFDLSRVADDAWNRGLSALLLRNSLRWASNEPVVALAPWPKGREAAVVVLQHIDDSTGNADRALDTLRRAGVPATHLFPTALVHDRGRDARAFVANGEVASQPDEELRVTRTGEEQTEKFRGMRDDLAAVLDASVAGVVSPMERLDPAVTSAWVNAGGLYIVAGNAARSASPELLSVDGREIVLLPRVADDDAVATRRAGNANVAAIDTEYAAALEKLHALGGLYLLRYHSRLLARPDRIPALARAARSIAADSALWAATARDVAAWWMARAHTTTDVVADTNGTITLHVANGGATPLTGAVLRVSPGTGRHVVAVAGASLLGGDDTMTTIALPVVAARSTHVVELHLIGSGRPHAR